MVCTKCTSTGLSCCHGDYSIFTTLKDAKRVAKHLNKEINEVVAFKKLTKEDKKTNLYKKKHHRYCYDLEIDGRLLVLIKNKDGSCGFQGKDGRCTIYEVSPLCCKIFPFWFDDGVIIDNNGLTCPIIGRKKESIDEKFKKMGKTKGQMHKLGLQLDNEVRDYEKNILQFIDKNRIKKP